MTGPEADRVGRRLALHLRKNDFAICQKILKSMENQFRVAEPYRTTAIAELDLELRYINMLENGGFVLISDMDHINVDNLELRSKSGRRMLGDKGKQTINRALGRTVQDNRQEKEDDDSESN